MIPSNECMAHNHAQVWKNNHHTFAHSIHLLVLCFEVLKVFLESMVMSSKLHNIDLLHCLHKNIVVSICKINDRRKNIIPILLIIVLPCVGVVREIRRLTIRGWWLLLDRNFVFCWDKSTTLGFLCTPRTFGIGSSLESFGFPCDSKFSFSSCVSCVGVGLHILSPLTLMFMECNGIVTFLSPWNTSI